MGAKKELNERERKRNKTTISLNSRLIELLDKYLARLTKTRRDIGQSHVITEQLSRFDALLRIERRVLREIFTQEELNLMLNNALSTIYSDGEGIIGEVLADTQDEIDANFEYFGVDRKKIVDKLKALTPGQQFALVDWLEELRANADKE